MGVLVTPDRMRIFQDEDGQWRWHVRAPNGEIISHGESHTRREDAVRAALRANPHLEVEE